MSNTRISVEKSHKDGMWLASIDMTLGEGQNLSFTYMVPVKPDRTIVEMEHGLLADAHRLLGEIIQRSPTL